MVGIGLWRFQGQVLMVTKKEETDYLLKKIGSIQKASTGIKEREQKKPPSPQPGPNQLIKPNKEKDVTK